MPPYDLINWRYFLFMMAVGIGLSLLVILARGSRTISFSLKKQTQEEIDDSIHEFGGGVTEKNSPVPLFILVIITGVLVWSVGYTIYSGIFGL